MQARLAPCGGSGAHNGLLVKTLVYYFDINFAAGVSILVYEWVERYSVG